MKKQFKIIPLLGMACLFTLSTISAAIAYSNSNKSTPAYAATGYIERSWNGSEVVSENKTATSTIGLKSVDDGILSDGGWYQTTDWAAGKGGRYTVQGTANIILCDNTTFIMYDGITVPEGSVLNIYGQGNGSGTITINNGNVDEGVGAAGIGSLANQKAGTINIHGGSIVVYNREGGGAGIGSGKQDTLTDAGANITVYGGSVLAQGTNGGAGIGGGANSSSGTITVHGGSVYAIGSEGSFGVGPGSNYSTLGTLTVSKPLLVLGNNTSEPSYPSDIKYNYDTERWMRMKIGYFHQHNWAYKLSDDGEAIIAYCTTEDYCPQTTGLSLSFAAKGTVFKLDGDQKRIGFNPGYLDEAFPNAYNKVKFYDETGETFYHNGADTYIERVTFGEATIETYFSIVYQSNLYVNGYHINTNGNRTGDGWSYVASTNTLTLNNYHSDGRYYNYPTGGDGVLFSSICYLGSDDLNIELVGNNVISSNAKDAIGAAIYSSQGNLVFKGDGYLTITSSEEQQLTGILCENHDVTFDGGVSNIDGYKPIEASNVIVKNGSRLVASGHNSGIVGLLKNEIEGSAYVNRDQTGNKVTIQVNNAGQDVSGYHYIKFPSHDHNWSYTASGNKITASCNEPGCYIQNGLTLTLNAPTGDMKYDGNAKVATIEEGYNPEAFPNPQIKYFSDGAEVSECVNVGKYSAKVTFGGATASVDFEILNTTVTDPDNPDVYIEVDNAVVSNDIRLKVELREEVIERYWEDEYPKIEQMLAKNEVISRVYDVKLIRIDSGIQTEIQPSDIQPGLVVTVRMAIPNGIKMSKAKLLHIPSTDDMKFLTDYKVEGNELVFKTNTLREFAFVTKAGGGSDGSHGFCIGVILLIINLLIAIAGALYVLLRFGILNKWFKKYDEKLNGIKEKVTSKEVLLTFITTCALAANFLLDLIVLIAHACPLTVISFIIGLALFGGIAFWYVKTRLNGEMTPIEEKSVGKLFEKLKDKLKKKKEENK